MQTIFFYILLLLFLTGICYAEEPRIAALSIKGHLFVKEGNMSANWVKELENVKSFALEGNRLGALLKNGNLLTKEGWPSARWFKELENVKSFTLEGNRIGALLKNGDLLIKEGGLSANWVKELENISDFDLLGFNNEVAGESSLPLWEYSICNTKNEVVSGGRTVHAITENAIKNDIAVKSKIRHFKKAFRRAHVVCHVKRLS